MKAQSARRTWVPGGKGAIRQKTLDEAELVIDNFAGWGGAGSGIALALGRSVDVAINHNPAAVAVHMANHPDTRHYTEDVFDVDPLEVTQGLPVGLAWFSPDCTHFSKAKGGKPVSKKIRGLAWVVLKWAALVRPRVMMLENVEEFKTWGPLIAARDGETGRLLKKVYSEDGESCDIVVTNPGEKVPPELLIMHPDPERKGETFAAFVACLTTGLAPDHPAWEEIRETLDPDKTGHFPFELLEKGLGYAVEFRLLRACDFGAPTIRTRLFGVMRCDGRPIVWPQPTHGDPQSAAVRSGKVQPWRTAAEIIDWSIPCPSIFERKRPLKENTLRRIARGIQKFAINNPNPFVIRLNYPSSSQRERFVDEQLQTSTAKNDLALVSPFVVPVTHHGADRVVPIDGQLPTVTAAHRGELALISPTLIQMGYGEREGQDPRVLGLERSLGTVVAGGNKFAVATAFLSRQFGQSVGHAADVPTGSVMAGGAGGKSALVAAFLAKHYGGGYTGAGSGMDKSVPTVTTVDHNALVTSNLIKLYGTCAHGQSVTEPVATVTSSGFHLGEVRAFLVKYFSTAAGQACDEPLHTATAKARFGLVTIHGEDYQIVDIGMRMLEPRELFNAQGFPDDYIIDRDINGRRYSKAAQVAGCGNAVPPAFAKALVEANLPELCVQVAA